MTVSRPSLEVLAGVYAIHRLEPDAPLPAGLERARFCWIGRTDEELSIVCDAAIEGVSAAPSRDWTVLRVLGPLPLSLTGVLAGLAAVLAEVRVSVFAVSTYDTDYLLVPAGELDRARYALALAGYRIRARRPAQ